MYDETLETSEELANAYRVISDHLTDNNAHSFNLLFAWHMGDNSDPRMTEILYRADLVLHNFLEAYTIGKRNGEESGN